MIDLKKTAEKWQERWEKEKAFEADPDRRPKFFANAPYPYINAYPHIGHLFTFLRSEAFARYKRMQGYNVLFPQGWHATGSPIINAAERVMDREEKQIKIMHDMGFSDEQIKKFEKPEYWIEFFAPEFRRDFKRMGMSIDWRREFHTTSLNPQYDRFITWQFNTLKKKGYVGKGTHPVVWCTKDNSAVGDHSRVHGEGETPQEMLLFKFRLEDGSYVVTATLRHDTCMGITNIYANPKTEYVKATVGKETWIIGEPAAGKLIHQDHEVTVTGKVSGQSLIGKKAESFDKRKILILPATFLDPDYGTGLVHSVPSDSADDLIALKNLQDDDKLLARYGLDPKEVRAITPIGIFNTPDVGEISAQFFIDKYNVTSQNQRDKLDSIKKELYKLTYTRSTFGPKYNTVFSQDLEGMAIPKGQDIIKDDLISRGHAALFYELTGKVVCRCLTPSIVKIVKDQWFLFYGNAEWKKLTHECLDSMKIYPDKARAQFDYVLDWLRDWACTREQGLGTELPWDRQWVIESLSDSTIYMAYYTIAHKIKDIEPDLLDDRFFDYVFLKDDSAKKSLRVGLETADSMRTEFDYWYPFDFRNSGKDLIQNHLSFCLFNHTAIFPKDKWPKGFGVNGWVTVDGQKMSKSLGNMIPLRDMAEQFSPDVSRITILSGGESMDDPNWDSELAKSQVGKLRQFYDFCMQNYGKGGQDKNLIDRWMEQELLQIIRTTTGYMEETLFRSAIQQIYFELQKKIRWYKRRSMDNFNRKTMEKVIETQLLMLAPFAPHVCEEAWEAIGKNDGKDFISLARWPSAEGKAYDRSLCTGEDIIESTIQDIGNVKKLAKIDHPKKVILITAHPWKYSLFSFVEKETAAGTEKKDILKKAMSQDEFRRFGQDITKFLPKLLAKPAMAEWIAEEKERQMLEDAKGFIATEAGCTVEIISAKDSTHPKAGAAMPAKPAIVVE